MTESRLALVIQALAQLAEATAPGSEHPPDEALAQLAEATKLPEPTAAAEPAKPPEPTDGRPPSEALPQAAALERLRDCIALAGEMTAGFPALRDELAQRCQALSQGLADQQGERRQLLDALLGGASLMAESEPGRRFAAFWRLAQDPQEAQRLRSAIDSLMSRSLASQLLPDERRFLLRLPRTLGEEGAAIQQALASHTERLQSLAKGSAEPKETAAPNASATAPLPQQRLLAAPAPEGPGGQMQAAAPPQLDLQALNAQLAKEAIDYPSLKRQLTALLAEREQVSIGDLLARYPAAQGLGSLLGLLSLGQRLGTEAGEETETVSWQGKDAEPRQVQIPKILFTRAAANELA